MFPGQIAAACLGGGLHWKNITENVRQPLFVVSFTKLYILEIKHLEKNVVFLMHEVLTEI